MLDPAVSAAFPDAGPLATMAIILAVMAALAAAETFAPLQARNRWSRAHIAPNLTLTSVTFATNILFNAALVFMLEWQSRNGAGVLPAIGASPFVHGLIVLVALDAAFYFLHLAMHRVPVLWRFHRVHHCDPMLDVTSTIRQHPGETAMRAIAIALVSIPLGATPAAFATYRLVAAVSGLLEHANIRVPAAVARALALVTTWPDMHKIHHSRDARLTDTNYSNIFSVWDRLFGTFTPASAGRDVAYGLEGFDEAPTQSVAGLMKLPFRAREPRSSTEEPVTPALQPQPGSR